MPSGRADRIGAGSSDEGPSIGTLFVVATPIGNLGDLSERARSTLAAVDLVVAEDTRRTRALLAHLGLSGKELRRLDGNASAADAEEIADRVASGARCALVTDAGTPVVSDPGGALVRATRERGAAVVTIPGPSAVTAALSVSGYPITGFRFVGFLPRGGVDRAAAIAGMADGMDAVVLFEAPHRMSATLEDLARAMPARRAMIARELTKLHEELLEGPLTDLGASLRDREWLGEITVVLAPWEGRSAASPDAGTVDALIASHLAAGKRAKEIAERVALETGLSKSDVYDRVLAIKRK